MIASSVLVWRQAGSADEAAQPGGDLFHAERLGDVVVAAGADAGHPVLDRVAGGQEQHADRRVECPQPAQHLEAVDVGQPDVEHDDVRLERVGHSRAAPRARSSSACVANLRGASSRDSTSAESGFVVDDEHPQRRRSGSVRWLQALADGASVHHHICESSERALNRGPS